MALRREVSRYLNRQIAPRIMFIFGGMVALSTPFKNATAFLRYWISAPSVDAPVTFAASNTGLFRLITVINEPEPSRTRPMN
jgi:hypothetical protein